MTNEEAIKQLAKLRDAFLEVYDNFNADVLDYAIDALSRDRWISVESNLPVSGLLVLAATEYGVYYGFLNGNRKWFVANNAIEDAWTWNPLITHWMPLPEPPKEDKP